MLSRRAVLGRLLRMPLKLVPRTATIPMLHPRLLGMRWRVESGPHGYWLGIFEPQIRREIARSLQPGDVFFDVGAHAGFYSLLASRLVGPTGRVFAFEPDPINFGRLEHHLSINQVENVLAIRAAVAKSVGTGLFVRGSDSSTGALASDATEGIEVETLSLNAFNEGQPPPNLVKMDIEGGEVAALEGAEDLLENVRPLLILSLHGEDRARGCMRILGKHHYKVRELTPDTVLAVPVR